MRWLARVEGLSYLLLLFVAMPLKYVFDDPWLVHQLGRVHGVLLLALWVAIARRGQLSRDTRWTGLVTSMIPLGFLFFEAAVSREQEAEE